jgi:hypothetical protein
MKVLKRDIIAFAELGIQNIQSLIPVIGRMNAVKGSAMNKIKEIYPTSTVIDAWRMKTYDYSSYNGLLFTLRISPSPIRGNAAYGMKQPRGYSGLYQQYRITINVLARHDDADKLEGKTAYDAAQELINYLTTQGQDLPNGVLYYEDFTSRESDPSETGAHLSRVIVECTVIANRPFRLS